MKSVSILFYSAILSALLTTNAWAAPALTYHGRLLNTAGEPVKAVVQFKLQIRTPGAEDCLLYEETQSQDLSLNNGVFALGVNDGTGTRTDGGVTTMQDIMSNASPMSFPVGKCTIGTTYTPALTDGRVLKISFNDGTFAGWEDSPAVAINSVPRAIDAMQIDGFSSQNLMRVANAGVPQVIPAFTPTDFTDLQSLIAGTSPKYLRSTATGTNLPTLVAPPPAPSAGQLWYNTSNGKIEFYDGTVTQTVGVASGSVSSVGTGTGLTGGPITSSGTIALASVGVGGTTTKPTYDVYGRITGNGVLIESDIPTLTTAGKVSGNTITSGTIGGSTSINTTGTVTAASSSVTAGALQSLAVYKVGNANKNTITTSSSQVVDLSLVLPTTAGTNGQFLKTDGAGVLSWFSPTDASITYTSQAANTFFAAPAGASGVPTYRAIVAGDLPTTGAAAPFVNGGNAFASASSIGNTSNFDLNLITNNSPSMTLTAGGNVGVGTILPNGKLDVKGSLVMSGATSGFVGFRPMAAAGSTVWTLPNTDGTANQVLRTDGAGTLSWSNTTSGTVTSVTSPNSDIAVATGTTTPALTLNSGTGANQIVKLTAASKYPAVDGSLITSLDATNISAGTLPTSRGGTGATSFTNYGSVGVNGSGNLVSIATGTSNQMLQSSVTGPVWSTATFPSATSINQILYSSAANVVTGLATANNGVLQTNGSGVPSIGSTLPAAVQGNITSVGTVTSGTWNGTVLAAQYGGTGQSAFTIGDLLYASSTTALSKLAASTSGYVLVSNGAGTAPSWQAIPAQGDFKSDGSVVMTGALKAANGTAALPSVSFTNSTGTGIYRAAADQIGISIAGVEKARIDTSGNVGIGTTLPNGKLDVKGSLVMSGATSGFVGFQPAAVAGSTIWTLPSADGAGGQVLKTDGAGLLSWVNAAVGSVTSVSSTNGDITVATGTSTPALTLNAGTGAGQIVKLTAASKYPAVDGSLITNLDATNIAAGTLPTSRGGTGATSFANYGVVGVNGSGNLASITSGTASQLLLSSVAGPVWSTATFPATTTANQLLYSSATNVISGVATANNGVMITSGAGVPSIASTLPSAVQANITTVGTIGTGTWNGTVVSAPYGGTGQSTYAVGDLLYASTTSALSRLPASTAGYALISNGAGTAPTWQAIPAQGDFKSDGSIAMTGALRHADGTAALPSMTFTNSTGTGFYRAAADQIGVSTAGTEKIRIDASGNIGMGVAVPTAALHVATAAAASQPAVRVSGTWYTGGTATTTKPQVLIEPSAATSTAWNTSGTGLGVNAPGAFAGNLVDLQVNGTSKLQVTSAGAIYGSSFNNLTSAANSSVTEATTGTQIARNIGDASPALTVTQTHASSTGDIVQLKNNASTVFTVQQNGFVGIGVTPTTALDLSGAMTVRPMAAPALSSAGQGRIYFDSTANVFQVSQNGGAYVNLATSGTQTFTGNQTYSGTVSITNATASTNSSSGALVVTGGAGVAGNLNVGGNSNVTGSLSTNGNLSTTSSTAATGGANANSPGMYLNANYWTGAASAQDQWSIQTILGAGANPTSTLTFAHPSGTTGVKSYSFPAGGISTAGNITLASSNSVITGATGVTLEQTGDTYGTTRMYLQNRNGVNGAMFEQAGTVDVIDLVFKGLANQRNIRYDNRSMGAYQMAQPELELGAPGDPTMNVADTGVAIRKGGLSVGTTIVAPPAGGIAVGGNVQLTAGQMYSAVQTSSAASPLTYNANNGNTLIWTTATVSPVLNIQNMKAGANYSVIVSGSGTGAVTLNCYSDAGVTLLPISMVPANGTRVNGTLNKSVYTLMNDGTNCLVTWITGF